MLLCLLLLLYVAGVVVDLDVVLLLLFLLLLIDVLVFVFRLFLEEQPVSSPPHLEDVGWAQRGHQLHQVLVRDAGDALLQGIARGRVHHVLQLLVAQIFSQQPQRSLQIVLGNVVLFSRFNTQEIKLSCR